MEEKKLRQLFKNRADAYLNTIDESVEQGMSEDCFIKAVNEVFSLHVVGSSLPDLRECNQASLDYATKKNNPDFFLIKQTFKDGVNWALNYVTRPK
tara:strand:+ start:51 stop:338 length:288 start_codon:yes stop_codon:yes gene_type:complete